MARIRLLLLLDRKVYLLSGKLVLGVYRRVGIKGVGFSMKIIAIVQARMQSSRLPGKVMKNVMGKPMLSYLLERLSSCVAISRIIVATSNLDADTPLAQYVQMLGYHVFRGDETDVLERYYLAAQAVNPDAVVRVTGDCPLVDPLIVDRVIREFLVSGADYVHTGQSFAEGLDVEIFTFLALEKAFYEAKEAFEREHVAMYMHRHPELFKKITLENDLDDSRYRFSVDYQEDFDVIRGIFEGLYRTNPLFSYHDIKRYLDLHADLIKANSHIVRNEALVKGK